jgi:hypothetical protein
MREGQGRGKHDRIMGGDGGGEWNLAKATFVSAIGEVGNMPSVVAQDVRVIGSRAKELLGVRA